MKNLKAGSLKRVLAIMSMNDQTLPCSKILPECQYAGQSYRLLDHASLCLLLNVVLGFSWRLDCTSPLSRLAWPVFQIKIRSTIFGSYRSSLLPRSLTVLDLCSPLVGLVQCVHLLQHSCSAYRQFFHLLAQRPHYVPWNESVQQLISNHDTVAHILDDRWKDSFCGWRGHEFAFVNLAR